MVQNARQFDHITPILTSIHWLPIHVRPDFNSWLLKKLEMGTSLYTCLISLNLINILSRALRIQSSCQSQIKVSRLQGLLPLEYPPFSGGWRIILLKDIQLLSLSPSLCVCFLSPVCGNGFASCVVCVVYPHFRAPWWRGACVAQVLCLCNICIISSPWSPCNFTVLVYSVHNIHFVSVHPFFSHFSYPNQHSFWWLFTIFCDEHCILCDIYGEKCHCVCSARSFRNHLGSLFTIKIGLKFSIQEYKFKKTVLSINLAQTEISQPLWTKDTMPG